MGRVHNQGTAVVGGDVSGNTRGANAVDIQSGRTAITQVASGFSSIAFGRQNTVSSSYGTAIGLKNTVSGYYSTAAGYNNTVGGTNGCAFGVGNTSIEAGYGNTTAIGNGNTSSGSYSTTLGRACTASATSSLAIGGDCLASATSASAIGYKAEARVQKTANICGPQINRRDDGESAGDAFESFCGVEVVLMTKEVDLKAVADQTITLPSGCKFWFDEMGLIATDIDTLTVQPTIRFGITGTPAKQNAAAITTAITAAGKREIETPLVPEDGETSLVAGVTVAATATTAKGRFWFRGLLIEDE